MATLRGVYDMHAVPVTVVTGTGGGNSTAPYYELRLMYDDNGGVITPFYRLFAFSQGGVVVVQDYDVDLNDTYVPQGVVKQSPSTEGTIWQSQKIPDTGLTLNNLYWLYVDVITVDDALNPPTLAINGSAAFDLYEGQRLVFSPFGSRAWLEGDYVFTASANDVVVVRYVSI